MSDVYPFRRMDLEPRRWPLREAFVISRQAITEVETVHVTLRSASGVEGQGEAAGLDYKGETAASMIAQLERVRGAVEEGCDRDALLRLLPGGGARHALDAALWDLEAKSGLGDPFTRAGLSPAPVTSCVTLGMKAPADLAEAARSAAQARWIKVKVGRDDPVETVRLVRDAAPAARLIVDPNQAWTPEALFRLAPLLAPLGVDLLEQPIPAGEEAALDGWPRPIPLCADEAFNDIDDLPRLAGRFDAVNIKLDKAGGLTAALRLADAAQALGLELMVGCMLGPSLSVAPAMVLAQRGRYLDLDAPPFLARDSAEGRFAFEAGHVSRPHIPALWG